MQKSFGEVSNLAITFDTIKFAAGYGLMFAYASFMLGKPNLVEQRVYLAGSGIVGVAMGVVIAMGLTMLMGFFYTPLHGVMVYLCLGLYSRVVKSALVHVEDIFGTRCKGVGSKACPRLRECIRHGRQKW